MYNPCLKLLKRYSPQKGEHTLEKNGEASRDQDTKSYQNRNTGEVPSLRVLGPRLECVPDKISQN